MPSAAGFGADSASIAFRRTSTPVIIHPSGQTGQAGQPPVRPVSPVRALRDPHENSIRVLAWVSSRVPSGSAASRTAAATWSNCRGPARRPVRPGTPPTTPGPGRAWRWGVCPSSPRSSGPARHRLLCRPGPRPAPADLRRRSSKSAPSRKSVTAFIADRTNCLAWSESTNPAVPISRTLSAGTDSRPQKWRHSMPPPGDRMVILSGHRIEFGEWRFTAQA